MKSTQASQRWPLMIFPLVFALMLGIYPIPKQGEQLLTDARLASQRSDYSAAARAYEQAAIQVPSHPEFWEQAGLAAFLAQDYDKAARCLEAARARASLSNAGLWKLGDAYQNNGELPQAFLAWEAAALGSSDPSVYGTLADAYLENGQLAGAASALEHWQVLVPDHAEAAYRLGLVLAVTAPEEAHRVFSRAGELDFALVPAINRIETGIATALLQSNPAYRLAVVAQALGGVGEWRVAKAALRQALDLQPGYAEAWALLGEARQHLGQDGGEEIGRALSLDPDSFLSLSLAALHSQRRQEWSQAVEYLQKIAAREPENPRWQIELGASYAGLGDLNSAYEHYFQAVELAPGDASVWQQLAGFSLSTNFQVEETGIPAARQAVKLAPEDASSLDLLAQVYMAAGDLVSAGKFLSRAVAADLEFALAYLHLGMVQKEQGLISDALKSFLEAVRLAPDTQSGIQAKRLLDELSPVNQE